MKHRFGSFDSAVGVPMPSIEERLQDAPLPELDPLAEPVQRRKAG
jgi:hypothetical protein